MNEISERLLRRHRELEKRMIDHALGVWMQAEVRAEDLRHPDYERHVVEKAERYAEQTRLTLWRREQIKKLRGVR